ncbi:hypothetical protein ACTMU2_01925 [Cupriavidus basilensis]
MFQPIVLAEPAEMLGYEALYPRPEAGTPLATPERLFRLAQSRADTIALEIQAAGTALPRPGAALDLHGQALPELQSAHAPASACRARHRPVHPAGAGISPARIVDRSRSRRRSAMPQASGRPWLCCVSWAFSTRSMISCWHRACQPGLAGPLVAAVREDRQIADLRGIASCSRRAGDPARRIAPDRALGAAHRGSASRMKRKAGRDPRPGVWPCGVQGYYLGARRWPKPLRHMARMEVSGER